MLDMQAFTIESVPHLQGTVSIAAMVQSWLYKQGKMHGILGQMACPQGVQKMLAARGMLLCPQQLLPQLLHLRP